MEKVESVWSFMTHWINQVHHSPGRTLNAFWDFSRCYFYVLAFWSLVCSKVLHLYAHLHSLPTPKFFAWGLTFFFQDVVVLLFLRNFAHKSHTRQWLLVALDTVVVVPFSLIVSCMAAANFSVYISTGAEIHWRQAKSFTGDKAAIRTLLTGLTCFLIGEGLLSMIAVLSACPIHRFMGGFLHVLVGPLRWLLLRVRPYWGQYLRRRETSDEILPHPEIYERISLENDYLEDSSDDESWRHPLGRTRITERPLSRLLIIIAWSAFFLLRLCRPSDPIYLYLSGALPLAPLFQGSHRKTPVDVESVPPELDYLRGASSLHPPPQWSWMPAIPGAGFEDWNRSDPFALHYNSEMSPLHISNLDQPVLEPVQKAISKNKLKIKHVVLLKLESTRTDVFPLQNGSFIFEKILESYANKELPNDVQRRIANLTPTAERLTGMSPGFEYINSTHTDRKAYGGISASNAYTTSTYTLKSLAGTLCGVTPLIADFNREWDHHIYQPCLAHIFRMLSQQPGVTNRTEDFTKWPWHSAYMQSVTDGYDSQNRLTTVLGYNDTKTKEIIESPKAKHYPVKTEEINYYGYADTELEEYIRDAIDDAQHNNKRLFLTHLTGTTHHPWGIPNNTYQQIIGPNGGKNENLNHYLNAIGFVDKWLAKILDILEEKGIAQETLLVMAGDHGLSLPNDGGITPYDNPHVGNFHVPLVFAHPKLPPIQINEPVISSQVLPSILDLLIESSSLTESASGIASDVRALYEGQSLIRPLIQEKKGRQAWQFTVMNTGGSWLAVRSAARPEFRLVIPLVNDVEWRFSDLKKDPNELEPISRFSLADLVQVIRKQYGKDVLEYLYEAAYVANFWVLQNWDLYKFDPNGK
ncbi:hypothetical protein N7462_009052 [Penicillium macrosclerotiorum]|uniref:uncharacterized protein n=1 Tax=Penicillium macrosclerotiorum TaxID=303699 RepID=UPI002546F514|nr:uncharacterized protein N7462_009052 [Penicillium macrosclerotiorum]KAJ5676155.1 hypothetical protein N7462_009052 [Penicillium macrosclerotiorum]